MPGRSSSREWSTPVPTVNAFGGVLMTNGTPSDVETATMIAVDGAGSSVSGGYVRDAKRVMMEKLQLPFGYGLEWSGQFASLERATQQLRVVIPITLLIIVSLLHLLFHSVIEVGIVMLSPPFALVGGV